jgi:hypothetical protein
MATAIDSDTPVTDSDIDVVVPMNEHLRRALADAVQILGLYEALADLESIRFFHKVESPYIFLYFQGANMEALRDLIAGASAIALEGFHGNVFEHLPFDALQIMKKLYKR